MGCSGSQLATPRGNTGESELGRDRSNTKHRQKQSVHLEQILRGHLSLDCPSTAKIVRIFTSSTFTDTRHERNALMERVYPALKELCQQQGYEFQVVDMRWGIRDEATDDHMTTELCLREVDLCKKLSTGPYFVINLRMPKKRLYVDFPFLHKGSVERWKIIKEHFNIQTFLSHKYGYRNFPREIDASEFESLIQKVQSVDTIELLQRWFKKDENAIPPIYVLQPISSILPDFQANDESRKKTAKTEWAKQNTLMQSTLATTAKKHLEGKKAERYALSVTEAEIDVALTDDHETQDRCLWFDRKIQDIDNQEASYLLSRYKECLGPEEKDQESRERLSALRDQTLTQHLPKQNIQSYNIMWTPDGIDPNKVDDHRAYIDQLCNDFRNKLSTMITSAIRAKQETDLNSPVFEEVVQHTLFCQEKCRAFQGRKQTLQAIEEYLLGSSKHPFTLHGPSGSGKTSIMATAATEAWNMFNSKAAIVIRFIGTTPDSSTIGSLLVSAIKQLGKIYKFDTSELPPTTKELRESFKSALGKASKDTPLILFLDSLDQIDSSGDAKQLSWLPRQLPDNVKIVLSTLPEQKYEVLPRLKALYPDIKGYVEVPKLDEEEVTSILDTWLDQAGRTLTTNQRHIVEEAFNKCPLPLFLKLSFDQTLSWRSYTPAESTGLQSTVRGCIDALFQRLEGLHGKILVEGALGYLTLSKSGLSESELEDILSCDDDVLNDVYMYWTPPVRRLPPLLLVRLRADLGQYLVDRGADGVRVFFWYHRQFIEAATDRYCSNPKQERRMHESLAEFFSGTWANGKTKPYTDSNGQSGTADRHVTSQPVQFGANYNRRKLNNLPNHRLRAGQIDQLLRECLCNLEFVMAKLKSEGLRKLLDDYLETNDKFPDNLALRTVMEAIHLSQAALLSNSDELPSQLIARIKDSKGLEDFLSQCHASTTPYLLPNHRVVTQTGGPLLHSPAEHTDEITDVDITTDGKNAVTCGMDETIKIWDVGTGKLLRSIDETGQDTSRLYIACDNTIIVVATKNTIRAFELQSGVEVYTLSHYMFNSAFCVAADDRTAILVFLGKNVQIFSAADGTFVGTASNGHVQEDEGMGRLSSIAGSGDLVAVAESNAKNKLYLFNLKDSKFLKTVISLPVSDANMKDVVSCVTFSADRKHVIVGAGQSRDILFFDIDDGELLRTLPGMKHDRMSSFLHTSRDGKYLISSNWNHVVIWDLQQSHRHIVLQHLHRSIINALSVDMRIFVTASSDLMLRIWDLTRDDETQGLGAPLAKQRDTGHVISDADFVIKSLYLMDVPRYVLLHGSFQHKGVAKQYIRVYDVTSSSVVRQIKLAKSDQMIVPYGDRSVLVGSWDRTVKVLDLVTLTFTKRLQGYLPKMATSPNDVRVIGGTKVVTPTKARSNVKVYSLETGKVIKVMKAGQTERVSGLQVGLSEKTLLASTTKGPLLIFDLETLTSICVICISDVSAKNILDVRVTSDDNFLLYKPDSGDSNSVVVWNIKKRKEHVRLHPHNTTTETTVKRFEVISPDTVFVITGDSNVSVYSVTTGKRTHRMVSKHGASRICCHYNSDYFATYSNQVEDNGVKLWRTSPVKCVASFTPDIRPREMYLSRDGCTPLGFFHTSPHPAFFKLHGVEGHTQDDARGQTDSYNPYSNQQYLEADLSEIPEQSTEEDDDPDSDIDTVT